jgi:hypothetical protein
VADGNVLVEHLKTPHAHALRKAMLEARRTLDQANDEYQHAFAICMDVEAQVDGAFGLVQAGRAYAAALTHYAEATMAWLLFVDTQLCPKKAGRAGEGA